VDVSLWAMAIARTRMRVDRGFDLPKIDVTVPVGGDAMHDSP
jgi:hypothetical protein